MIELYAYIGDEALRDTKTERRCIRQSQDITRWIAETNQILDGGQVVATFVIDTDGQLWIADRRSEHVACAAGHSVLSAGEITFAVAGNRIEVAEVTNQSLGYCPRPESWPAVAAALDRAGLTHQNGFTTAYTLRRCGTCGMKNIVKDAHFECGVCQTPLSRDWNFAPKGSHAGKETTL
jgi:hypothetical protein